MIGEKIVRVGGKTYRYPRNYVQEYKERSPEQKRNKSIRRRARNKMIEKYGAAALRGKDVDHKRGIGGGNGFSNLRITTKKFNRSRK